MSWIQTFTGRRFDVANPDPADVDPVDIAHALSQVNRFTGHTRWPYSVAEHCVHVHDGVEREPGETTNSHGHTQRRLYALLHDAAEAYICDVARPVKPLLKGYAELEARVEAAILARFGCTPTEADRVAVKRRDLVMLQTERRQLLGPSPEPWDLVHADGSTVYEAGYMVSCWTPVEAERVYLEKLRSTVNREVLFPPSGEAHV